MISVIITVYNRAHCVRSTIESCLSQSTVNYEIIIIDDGSSDDSYKVIEPYIEKYKHIKYFYQMNKGAAAAKNRGATESTGEYIFFLDSDDRLYDRNTLSDIDSVLKIGAFDFLAYESILIEKKSQKYILTDKYAAKSFDFHKHMIASPLNYAAKPPYVFNRDKFLLAGGFDENSRWGDALIFWRRFFSLSISVKIMNGIGYIYDQSDTNSISRNRTGAFYEGALLVMQRCYDENFKEILENKVEKNWQLIFLLYAIKAKKINLIVKYAKLLLSKRTYLIMAAFAYIMKSKVIK